MNNKSIVIGVVGAGSMGSGIAQVAATAGFRVMLYARRHEAFQEAVSCVAASLAKLHEKEVVAEEPQSVLSRMIACHELEQLSGCNIVIEAITEQMDAKSALLTKLGEILEKSAIIVSTTSSLSISMLGQASGRPERFIGMHFMNPVPLMEVVELIAGEQTAAETISFAKDLTVALGKTFVISKDQPGFIITRLLGVLLNEAFEMLDAGIASAEEIDTAMKLGAHHPMGPLALADMVGLDVILAAMETLSSGIDCNKYAPSKLLRNYVTQGLLGKKSGQGVYDYNHV